MSGAAATAQLSLPRQAYTVMLAFIPHLQASWGPDCAAVTLQEQQ
jgi:hypothetical protein